MKFLEGKSPAEKKKIIAAAVLGGLAILSLLYTFSGIFFGGSKKPPVTATASPTPTATATPGSNQLTAIQVPNQEQINSQWLVTPIDYQPGSFYAPDAGRNIFAFYEPARPTPYVPIVEIPTPTQTPTPIPTPTPTLIVSFVTPQTVFAGAKAFRLEVNGDKFTPETFIFWNGSQLPTNFISPQKLTADIPASLIAGEGTQRIEVRSNDGKLFALPVTLAVQPAPKPQFQYIGMIARRSGNNDTAYLQESGKPVPFGARLNDVVGGRFRVVSISSDEVLLEDTSLGFRHRLPIQRTAPGQTSNNPNDRRGNFPNTFPPNSNFQYNPNVQQNPPGIPQDVRPFQPQPQPTPPKKDDDDDDDDGDGN